ncbi:MAG: CBS domain-containing protein, partial [Mycobacteriales bacterium]
ITAVLIIFELTGDYTVVLPLMVAIVLAAGVSHLISADSIYTLKLRRRGIDIMRGRAANVMTLLRVHDAMQPVPNPLRQDTTFAEIIDIFSSSRTDALPVIDATGAYRGAVTSAEVEAAARDNSLDATAGDLAILTPTIHAAQTLEDALKLLVSNDRSGLPVVAADGHEVEGWLTHRDVLRAYSDRVQAGVSSIELASRGHPTGRSTSPGAPELSTGQLRGFRIVDLYLERDSPPVGKTVEEIVWPRASLLLGIRRGPQALTADADTVLARGDRLTVLVKADQEAELSTAIGSAPGPDTDPTNPSRQARDVQPGSGLPL